jgi:hypothetical protein
MEDYSSFYFGIGSCAFFGAITHFQNFQKLMHYPLGTLSAIQGFLHLCLALYEIAIGLDLMGIGTQFNSGKLREVIKNIAPLLFYYASLCLVNAFAHVLVSFNALVFLCEFFLSISIFCASDALEKNQNLILNPLQL